MVLYNVEVTSQVRREVRELPGNMRQRVIGLLKALKEEPRPHNSKRMDITKLGGELSLNLELYRIRIESWRILYTLEEELQLLTILAIRKRPPYQYDDLLELLAEVTEDEE
jgi:mRNA-degrading endonuclease RelE of RelBE toxin-antitoxin system